MLFNAIQGSLWTEVPRRLFGGARVGQVSSEFGMQVGLFDRPELWALHGGSLMVGNVAGLAAGGAGTRSQIALSMIPATRAIFILEDLILASSGAAQGLILGWSQTELANSTGNLVMRDSRRATTTGGSAPASARIRDQNNIALANLATETMRVTCPAAATIIIPMNTVIGPTWSLRVIAAGDNVSIDVNVMFVGRERTVTPDELAVL